MRARWILEFSACFKTRCPSTPSNIKKFGRWIFQVKPVKYDVKKSGYPIFSYACSDQYSVFTKKKRQINQTFKEKSVQRLIERKGECGMVASHRHQNIIYMFAAGRNRGLFMLISLVLSRETSGKTQKLHPTQDTTNFEQFCRISRHKPVISTAK